MKRWERREGVDIPLPFQIPDYATVRRRFPASVLTTHSLGQIKTHSEKIM